MRNTHSSCLICNISDFSIYFTNLFEPICKEYLTKLGATGSNPGKPTGICRYLCIISLQTWGVNVRIKKYICRDNQSQYSAGREKVVAGKAEDQRKKGEKVSKASGADRRDHRESFRLCTRQGRRHGLNHRQRVSSDIRKLCLVSGIIDTPWQTSFTGS